MGRRVLRHHIWGYSVCLCPIKRMPDLYGLKGLVVKSIFSLIRLMKQVNEIFSLKKIDLEWLHSVMKPKKKLSPPLKLCKL